MQPNPEILERIYICLEDYKKDNKKYPAKAIVNQGVFNFLNQNDLLLGTNANACRANSGFYLNNPQEESIEVFHLEKSSKRKQSKLENQFNFQRGLPITFQKGLKEPCTYDISVSSETLSQIGY